MENNTITWPGWETVRVIGRGSFGTVYEIRRDVLGDIERAALKHISIPVSEEEIISLQSEGMDAASITKTFREQLNDIVNEYKLMRRLNDCPYVVRCDDVQYIQKQDGFGWDIFIKMELLKPVTRLLGADTEITEEKVVALGKDISRALVRCGEQNILHRDIKIQNIFASEDGKYKLGDFGIARAKERTSTGTARVGTYDYMAPEVYFGKRYDKTADIYSLGMVLYWLLNNRRMPFLPQTEEAPRVQDRENARMCRLNGEKLPPPANGSKGLQKIILKCCAYKPENRYRDPSDLLNDLLALTRKLSVKKQRLDRTVKNLHPELEHSKDVEQSPKMTPAPRRTQHKDEAQSLRAKRKRRRRRRILLCVPLVFVLITAFGTYKMSQVRPVMYDEACRLYEAGEYADAAVIFGKIRHYRDSTAMEIKAINADAEIQASKLFSQPTMQPTNDSRESQRLDAEAVDMQSLVDDLNKEELIQRTKDDPSIGIFEVGNEDNTIVYKFCFADFQAFLYIVTMAQTGDADYIDAYNSLVESLPPLEASLENALRESIPGLKVQVILMTDDDSDKIVAFSQDGNIVYDLINKRGIMPGGVTSIAETEKALNYTRS